MSETLVVRPAEPRDHALFARFFLELGLNDPTPEPERWTAVMMPHTFFLESDGHAVGYGYVEVYGESGYVCHVVVEPESRGRGVGRALMDVIARRLRERGCTRWELNVKRDNAPAIRLYERVGMSAKYSTQIVRIDWSAIENLEHGGFALEACVPAPADDATIEKAFDLPTGQLAKFRSIGTDVQMQLRDSTGVIAGYARFSPSFPGAFPFRVKSDRFLRALLEALRPHARFGDTWLQLVIEDDADSARVLLDAGARPVYEILHMTGELPAPA